MRLLIADDHELVRDALSAFLSREGEFACETAEDVDDALARTARRRADLVLLDYGMPGMNGLEGLERMQEANGRGTVAIMSGLAPRDVALRALGAGAIGYVPKTMPAKRLIAAVRFMLAGERFAPVELMDAEPVGPLGVKLTARERQALDALARGASNKEIARDLDLAEVTVKLHVRTLCRKLGARNRTHAAVIARAAGLQ